MMSPALPRPVVVPFVQPLQSLHTKIDTERAAAQPEARLIQTFRRYAAGRQRSTLTPEQRRALTGVTSQRHADNVCRMVLHAHATRCQIARLAVAPADNTAAAATAADAVSAWVADTWTHWAGPHLHNQATHATLRDGSHGLALAWDAVSGRPRVAREPWWDGTAGLWVAYDDNDSPAYAVKEWTDGRARVRRIVWWPDRIERYINDGGWRPDGNLDPGAPDAWRSAWVDRTGAPLGLPVVHLRNSAPTADTADADNHYPPSILDGGVLGLQDEINDVHRDITAAARYTGYQMYAFFGVGEDPDTGQPPMFQVAPGAAFSVAGAGSAVVLPAGSIAELERTLNIKIAAVSRDTATPQYLITGGDWPSGEALQQADGPLAAATEALQASMGPAWGSLLHKATLMYNTFGTGPELDTAALIRPIYRPAAPIAPLTQAQRVQTLAPLVSPEEALRQLGYDPGEVQNIMQERAQAAARDTALTFVQGGP